MPAVPSATPWIGLNFWSRTGGPRMWTRYDPRVVREELGVLRSHGCNITRSFCYWPDFVPERFVLDGEVVARFADFLDAHRELGVGTVPTFIVGHMSGENWDPAWRGGRDLYRDVTLVADQAWFAGEIVRRFHAHDAVAGWLVSNEMPLYGGPASEDEVTSWARLVVGSIRAAGADQPVSLGDGAWGLEVTGNDNGYSLRALAPLVDFVGPHVYPMSDDGVRQMLAAAFACEMSAGFGRPVVLEEFGLSSDFVSDEHGAHYYRQVLHTSLLAGASGWLAWNNCDYDDLAGQDPYRHHPFEMHFGVTDRAGTPKAQLLELQRFSALLADLGPDGFEPVRAEAGIVVPEHFERVLPFTTPEYRRDLRESLFQSYIAAREADLAVHMLRERDGLAQGPKLLLLPSCKLLMAPTAERLAELAAGGATVFLSWFAGSTDRQRGSWVPSLDRLFGVRSNSWYGLVEPIEDDTVSLRFVDDLGGIGAGERLELRAGGNASPRRRQGGRRGRPWAPRPRPTAHRPGVAPALRLPARAARRQQPPRQPRADVADLRRAGGRSGGRATAARRRPARAGRPPARRPAGARRARQHLAGASGDRALDDAGRPLRAREVRPGRARRAGGDRPVRGGGAVAR
jgi:endo-1,4-beta-mannosidase